MKVLIALPPEHKSYPSIDDIISGQAPVNGTDGAMIRLAGLLTEAGFEVCLSTASPVSSGHFQSISHQDVNAEAYDRLILHQGHWNGTSLTFGNQVLPKTCLWLHLEVKKTLIYEFLQKGGYRVICPSQYLARWYRMLPGWQSKVVVIPNLYCPTFQPLSLPKSNQAKQPRLLFIGALGLGKGLVELTQVWSYLAQRQVELELAIAGSINLYHDNVAGAAGLAEPTLENTVITPWLDALPKRYQPKFLGSLSPSQLQTEIANSWAIIVNPSPHHPETFCIAAVEAEACDRTVFSVHAGALPETVYHDQFNSLAEGSPESLAERIITGLANPKLVAENGRLAGEYVRNHFDPQLVCNRWIDLLKGQLTETGLPNFGDSIGGIIRDLIRWSRTWRLIHQARK